jgi:hypothetical protein
MIEAAPERQQQQPNQGQRQQRDGRDNRDQNREQGGRDRFRPRWQDRRNDTQQGQGGEPRQNAPQPRNDEQPRTEPAPAPQPAPAADGDRWEAPSFLRRPAPAPVAAEPAAAEEAQAAGTPAPKRKYERRPRKDVAAESPSSSADDVKAPAAD